MLTYQDFTAANDLPDFITKVINEHKSSELYLTAVDADAYDKQRNTFILQWLDTVRKRRRDVFKQDIKIPCNLFRRLNRQRCTYLLGNGVFFTHKEQRATDGKIVNVDVTREALGKTFDSEVYDWGYKALIHGLSFAYWTPKRRYVYPVTQFAPLWDEETGVLRAGVRFWRIDDQKPMFAELYTEEGVYSLKTEGGGNILTLTDANPKPYLLKTRRTEARGEWVVGGDNYSSLPVIPMWGSALHQSTLVGTKARIDSIDLCASGFARDVRDCAKIYWLIENCGGMDQKDLDAFLDDILENHIAKVDSTSFSGDSRASLSPYVQDVPFASSNAYLKQASEALYQDFGGVDVHVIGADTTNDHLEAAFQPLDEEADAFEQEVTKAIKQGLALLNIDDEPQYKRNRIVNQKQTTDMVLSAANIIGSRKAMEKLPWLTIDEVEEIEQDEFTDARDRLTVAKPQTPADGEKRAQEQ